MPSSIIPKSHLRFGVYTQSTGLCVPSLNPSPPIHTASYGCLQLQLLGITSDIAVKGVGKNAVSILGIATYYSSISQLESRSLTLLPSRSYPPFATTSLRHGLSIFSRLHELVGLVPPRCRHTRQYIFLHLPTLPRPIPQPFCRQWFRPAAHPRRSRCTITSSDKEGGRRRVDCA